MTRFEMANKVARVRVSTPLGGFVIEASGRGLRAVTPDAGEGVGRGDETATGAASENAHAAAEILRRYAEGERVRYDGALDVAATPFHLAVWDRLRAIPFGRTVSYGEIAAALGIPGEARAVGAGVGANPNCILVPCHRVLAADGSLRGFAWGLDLKRRLLAHEGSAALSLFSAAASE
jgi:methylated-DNA-[protein]-cysteine S-methyltransferase